MNEMISKKRTVYIHVYQPKNKGTDQMCISAIQHLNFAALIVKSI